jgi:hypothetical protein
LQYQSDFEKKQAQEALNDPYTAIPQLIAQYQEMGIPFERSAQQIVQDFETSGQDLGTYLTELQKTIQSKPMYKAMVEAQMREFAPPVQKATESWTKLDDTTLYNQITGETKKVSENVASTYPSSFSGDMTSYIASKE